MTIISIIAALGKNRVIGLNNAMPWHIPEELQHFKKITMGKPMIMGRKTFDAIGRRLLPGRQTIVLTQDKSLHGDNFAVAHTLSEALQIAGNVPEVMIVGGAGIYAQFLPLTQRMYLSIIEGDYSGDAFFPEYEESEWQKISEQQYEKYTCFVYERL